MRIAKMRSRLRLRLLRVIGGWWAAVVSVETAGDDEVKIIAESTWNESNNDCFTESDGKVRVRKSLFLSSLMEIQIQILE